MNVVNLLGNLGSDAELKILDNGSAVLKFSLATSEKWKDRTSGEQREKTEWHRCVYFSKGAEKLAPYLKKGTKVALEGSIAYGSYEKDGVKMYTTDIKVKNIHFAGGKSGSGGGGGETQADDDDDGLPPVTGEDKIPF